MSDRRIQFLLSRFSEKRDKAKPARGRDWRPLVARRVFDYPTANRLFVVSSGFEEILNRRGQQGDGADEGFIVPKSSGPAFGGLKEAVERLDASIAVA